ncbi:MAG TPA: LTA synthase family protein [Candidatus Faecousia intestinigallinarum]|nr:LTA synthase family protein [Candidatus Faecousia intestinigallinarum]
MSCDAAPQTAEKKRVFWKSWTVLGIPVSFFLVEVFAFCFLSLGQTGEGETGMSFWPLLFGLVWAVLLTGVVMLLPGLARRIAYGAAYFLGVVYAGVQTGYFLMFREMVWLSDFRYASEGADYADVLLSFPVGWYLGLLGLIGLGVLLLWKFPRIRWNWRRGLAAAGVTSVAVAAAALLPNLVFLQDREIQYAGSDYGRAQSAQAAYENMFNAHRLYQVCGLYQCGAKDFYANVVFPLTPGYAAAQETAHDTIDDYFAQRQPSGDNAMTGKLAGKNVVLVLMESMDDWMIGEHTPTLKRLMAEGINFTSFYTPGFSSTRTFNTEFCINTGSFLSSQGGYAFDYVNNNFQQSLASQLTALGYSAKEFHYNSPAFYSRGVFAPALGYEEYVSYEDYVTEETEKNLYDDQFVFDNEDLSADFFRNGRKLNFLVTRSAHLSYVYNEVLSYWGLQKYPEYRGMTGNEEEDCAYLKARLVDDLFARLLEELEAHGELENTVIVAVTDHYTYGVQDQDLVLERSGVTDSLLLEKTPCFIWSADMEPLEVDKILNTTDLLPTLLNLLGVDSAYNYLGHDAFDPEYEGCAIFSNGSWIAQGVAYNANTKQTFFLTEGAELTAELQEEMGEAVNDFIRVNNLILQSDYYSRSG